MPVAMLIIALMVFPALELPHAQAQPTPTPSPNQNSWTTVAPMPTARGGLGVAVVNGKLYAIGGFDGNQPLNVNEEFTPAANVWTTEASMPTPRSEFAVAVYNGIIYCIGGTVGGVGSNEYVGNNEAYDPATNTWQTCASMPTPRADLSASVLNGKIYLVGGLMYSSKTPFYAEANVTEIYNPATNSWSTGASMPLSVYGYASAVINGDIHVVGGSKNPSGTAPGDYVNSNQAYDSRTSSWGLSANLPFDATFAGATSTTGFLAPPKLYLVGGFNVATISSSLHVYDAQNNTWSNGASMPTARAYLGLANVNDVLFAVGGFDGTNWLSTVEQYTPIGYGTTPPQIQITSPGNDTYSKVMLSYTVNRQTSWVGYSLDGKANVTLNGGVELYNLAQGAHSIILYANDSSGNMGSSNQVYFSVDSLPPYINMVMPLNQSYGSNDIQLTFTVNQNCTHFAYSLDGAANVTIEGNVTLPALSNGSHRITIYATGIYGLTGSITVYFTIAPFPTLTVVGIAASAIIVLASLYLFMPRRKPDKPVVRRKLPV